MRAIGSHTDSPCLRMAPHSFIKGELNQFNVVTYGGGLWGTWFDRDLGVAGRVLYRSHGRITSKLWDSARPLCRIPHLAIHLREKRDADTISKDTSLRPIFLCEEFQRVAGGSKDDCLTEVEKRNGAEIVKLISQQAKVDPSQIVDLDLYLYDCNPSTTLGLQEEFISSPRLDNLLSAFTSITALQDCEDLEDGLAKVAILFDHEEVGSKSSKGADSTLFNDLVSRLAKDPLPVLRQSFVLSADMAHGVHPNYASHHDPNHKILLNKGVVLKFNQNMRYAGTQDSHAIIQDLAARLGLPLQIFSSRNESPCGSTIGPFMASLTGAEAVDVGVAQFAMHSCR